MAKLEAPNGVLAYAYGFGGFDAYSYALGFDANFAVATFEAPSQSAVAVFPNPTFNRLNIDASFLMDQIDLFDMGGRLLIAEKPRSDQFPLDLTDLPPGIYMLKIKSNGTTISKKVVKMR
ncbi:MAG: T9SS type A sorting domain-containing protein [Bacteroidota bacterium]